MASFTMVAGIAVELLLRHNFGPMPTGLELVNIHRVRQKFEPIGNKSISASTLPALWTLRAAKDLPRRVREAVMVFDQSRRDMVLHALAALSVTPTSDGYAETSLVAGDFVIRHGMRIVLTTSEMAWWDHERQTTSYVADLDMLRRIQC